MHSTPQLKKLFDWGYKSVPQKHAWDRTIPQTRGKVLGGSSSVNGMLFVRGNRKNFDDWAAEGCKGWAYEDVLPAFKQARGLGGRRQRAPRLQRPDQGHPQARPHRGRAPPSWTPPRRKLGVPLIDDYNGESQEGVSVFQQSVGTRHAATPPPRATCTTAACPNLARAHRAQVVTGSSSRAPAPPASRCSPRTARRSSRAGREVDPLRRRLSAPPQLLMLSGIGPAGAPARRTASRSWPTCPWATTCTTTCSCRSRSDGLRAAQAHAVLLPARPGPRAAPPRLDLGGRARRSSRSASCARRTPTRSRTCSCMSLYWVYPVPNQDDTDQAGRPADARSRASSVFPTLIYPESRGTVRLASRRPDRPRR